MQLTVTPKVAADELLHCISVGLTPVLTSSPGMGKSSIVLQLCENARLLPIDIRLSQCTPEDLNGYPMRQGDKAVFTPFSIFPLKGDPIPEGYDGWCIFLDELTSATKPVQAAAYKLILDRMVGSFKLHPNVAIIGAGNKSTDKAIVTQMSTALQSRMIHYELEVSQPEWIDWAFKANIDSRIISFLSYLPSRLLDFRPDHQDRTFPCPRTWEFLSRLISGQEVSNKILPRVAGTIGNGVATEFIGFAKEFDNLPRFSDIVNDPKTAKIPPELSTKYATMTMLVDNQDEDSLDAVIAYVERFDIELQILFCRGAVAKNEELVEEHKGFAAYVNKMIRYLH